MQRLLEKEARKSVCLLKNNEKKSLCLEMNRSNGTNRKVVAIGDQGMVCLLEHLGQGS
jgi:hypothetical protein